MPDGKCLTASNGANRGPLSTRRGALCFREGNNLSDRRIPTAAQLRAARALLGWTMEDLAAASGVSSRTIRRAEEVYQAVSVRTLRRLAQKALEAAGVEFIGENDRGAGVRFRNRRRPRE
jgi:DNA-binding XRE family transcriptional regulator